DLDLEHEVEFVTGDAVLDVAVLDHAEEARDLGFDAEFFAQFANERGFHPLTGFDVAARQEEPGPGALPYDQELSVTADDGAGEELGGGVAHEVSFVPARGFSWNLPAQKRSEEHTAELQSRFDL